ncbi:MULTISPECIES: hypothetical protein [unclassified Lacinutrix]
MKKIVLTLLLLFVTVATSFGQGKFQLRQNAHFVEAAAKEYNLDDKQQAELSEFRLEMVSAYMKSNQDSKAGDITKEEMKASNREASKTFHNKLSKLTGKAYADMKDWLDEMREELKKVK